MMEQQSSEHVHIRLQISFIIFQVDLLLAHAPTRVIAATGIEHSGFDSMGDDR